MSDPDSSLAHDPIPDPSPEISSLPAASKTSKRLPPPCWTPEETTALIDAYRDKWHALNRGNLKADHWEEVAESVAATCPDVTPRKTAVQCRHKMEKLRQRYRAEIQRARSVPVARFVSSWVHFKRMEEMENRPETKPVSETGYRQFATPRFFNRNGGGGEGGSGGIRIRIPSGVSIGPRFSGTIEPAGLGAGVVKNPSSGRSVGGKRGSEIMSEDPIAIAIKLLGDAMLRTEEKKMEMTREIERMRMEMEMKRTKMVLEAQQRIVEAFAKTMSEKKKKAKSV